MQALGEERSQNDRNFGSQAWHQEAPMVADALRRGTLLTVTATSGTQWRGYVCDRDGLGLLLDLHDGPGYKFFPWSSVEHMTIQEARHLIPGETL